MHICVTCLRDIVLFLFSVGSYVGKPAEVILLSWWATAQLPGLKIFKLACNVFWYDIHDIDANIFLILLYRWERR